MTSAPPVVPETAPRNPFPVPSAWEKVLLRELVQVATVCYDRGWSYGTAGNFSLRGRDGVVWQSPSGLNKGALDPELFIPVCLRSAAVIMPLAVTPSLEMPVHLGIYRGVAAARCVVHTHPPHLVALCRSEVAELRWSGEEMQKRLGSADHRQTLRIPVLSNPTPAAMPDLADGLGAALGAGVPMVVLAAHGVYAWGKTPLEALSYIEAVEFLCRTAALCR